MKYVDLNKQEKLKSINTIRNDSGSKGIMKLFPIFLIAIVGIGLLFKFSNKIQSAFNPVNIIANVAAADLKQTDGRTNILIMGSDRRLEGPESYRSVLTDTLLVASIGKVDGDVVLISLPRDLWISNYSEKLNAVYALAENNGKSGSEELKKEISEVLGIPIHYHVMITFDLFKEIIDIVGGVEVNVENSFTDYYYPVEGKENAPIEERYETVKFEAGITEMDGETALKYVRSRHGDNNEGTDFARSRRQQKLIMAIKNEALSLQTLVNPQKLKELYDLYSNNVDTNIDFATIQAFYLLSQQINLDKVISVVLDDRSEADAGGLLYSPIDTTLYGGRYVLVPQTGDYSQIHAYVQKYLFSK